MKHKIKVKTILSGDSYPSTANNSPRTLKGSWVDEKQLRWTRLGGIDQRPDEETD